MTDQTSAHRRPKMWSLLGGGAVAATAIALLSVSLVPANAGTGSASVDADRSGLHPVAELDYHLGDMAFHVPGFHQSPSGDEDPETLPLADIELAADVHYPSDLRGGPYPLVVLLHGYWRTCDDRAAAAVVQRDEEAERTTTNPDELDRLRGNLTDPATHRPRAVNFTGRIDLHRVGTLGHSRSGRAVIYHAAVNHRAGLPDGVRIASVLSLAPAGAGTATNPDAPNAPDYRVTTAPLAVWMGSCDGDTSNQGEDYIRLAAGHTTEPVYRWMVSGANHNFLNTAWSPSSGLATAADDAPPRCKSGPTPGHSGKPAAQPNTSPGNERQLTETQERQVAAGYVTAFFARTLLRSTADERVISGDTHPLASITTVDAKRIDPTAR